MGEWVFCFAISRIVETILFLFSFYCAKLMFSVSHRFSRPEETFKIY